MSRGGCRQAVWMHWFLSAANCGYDETGCLIEFLPGLPLRWLETWNCELNKLFSPLCCFWSEHLITATEVRLGQPPSQLHLVLLRSRLTCCICISASCIWKKCREPSLEYRHLNILSKGLKDHTFPWFFPDF